MTELITELNDSRRKGIAAEIQQIQNRVGELQRKFADDTLAFNAGMLAWESTRLFWYAVTGEHDGNKLPEVEDAVRRFQIEKWCLENRSGEGEA